MIGYVPPLAPWVPCLGEPQPDQLPQIDPEKHPSPIELERGAPILLGSRGDEATPKVDYRFTPHEPLFKFGDGWSVNEGNSISEFPLNLGGDALHPIGVELTNLTAPGVCE